VSDLTIRVERLRVRLRGMSAEDARLAAAGLGGALAEALPGQAPAEAGGAVSIASLDAGAVRLSRPARPETVRAALAHSVGEALAERLPRRGVQQQP
jgi:hypothetical protein